MNPPQRFYLFLASRTGFQVMGFCLFAFAQVISGYYLDGDIKFALMAQCRSPLSY